MYVGYYYLLRYGMFNFYMFAYLHVIKKKTTSLGLYISFYLMISGLNSWLKSQVVLSNDMARDGGYTIPRS